MKKQIIALIIIIYGICSKVFLHKKHNVEKHILVIFPQPGIGDLVCALEALKNLNCLYPYEEGYIIHVMLNAPLYEFLKKIKSTYGYQYIPVNFENKSSLKNYLYILKQMRLYFWESIVGLHCLGYYIKSILLGVHYNKIFYLDFLSSYKSRPCIKKLVDAMLYNKTVSIISDNNMEFTIYENLFKVICKDWNGEIGIGNIPPLESSFEIEKKYCLVNIGIGEGHSYPYRGWPIESYAAVIDFLITKYNYFIVLTGQQNEMELIYKLIKLIVNKEYLINLVGKTNFNEWVELIRGAEFVLGNDSGYIHIAAAVNTKAFVIGGYWNYGRFHPYKVRNTEGVAIPQLIVSSEPICSFCSRRNYIEKSKAYLNAKMLCDQSIKQYKRYTCINEVSINQVISCIQLNID